MSGKVFGPSDRPTYASRSNSPTASLSPSSPSSSKASLASKLSSEGLSPKPSEKAKAEAKPKPEKEKEKEKGGNGKQKGKSGKSDKKAKLEDDPWGAIPCDSPFAKVGNLKDVVGDAEATADMLIQKLKLCEEVYNFNKDDCMPEKEGKRLTLLEILAYWPVSEQKEKDKEKEELPMMKKNSKAAGATGSGEDSRELEMSSGAQSSASSARANALQLIAAAVKVVKSNAFRTLIHKERSPMDALDGEDDEPYLEPTWPHLELVYDLLQKLLQTKELESTLATEAGLDKRFVTQLVELMETDDPREREDLKVLVSRIFGKFSSFRSTVRRAIQSFCQRAVCLEHGEAPAYGLSEVLELLSQRVVTAFSSPFREEQKDLLTQVVLPLYKLDFLSCFHSSLKDVVRLFCKKDATLIKPTAQALLRYWPQCASGKQTIFLGELEDLIHMMPAADFKAIATLCAHRISSCCISCHSEVAEKALGIWRHQPTVRSTVQNCRDDLPLIVSRLYSNITQAWGPNVMSRTMDVLKNFMEADRELFDNCSSKHRKQGDDAEKRESIRLKRWAKLQELHDLAHPERQKANRPREPRKAQNSGRPQLTCNQEVSLKQDSSCAFSLCWDRTDATPKKNQLQLQALLVNTSGKIVEAINSRNLTCFQSAVRLTSRAPQKNSKEACCGTIWATMDLLPVEIAMVLLVVTASNRSCLGDIAHDMALVVDFNGKVQLGEILAEPPPDAKMGLLGALRRLDWTSWNLLPKVEWATCEHFTDNPEMFSRVIKEAIPLSLKKHRGQASFVVMSKGSVADCPTFPAKQKVFLGMGWDFYSDENLHVEVALVCLTANGQHVSTVCGGQSVNGAFHTGDGALSAGIFVDFDALAVEVSVAFLTAHVTSEDFGAVQQPHCTAIDVTGREILRYMMPEEKKTSTGLIMARVFWNEFYDRWNFQALGNYCTGRTWSDSLEYMKSLVTVPPSSYQTLLIEDEDTVARGDHRSTTAASSSAQSVIMSL